MNEVHELDIYVPSFEEISDPDNVFHDPRWFESDLLPEDHEWAEVIGDFLFRCASVRRQIYTGKNAQLAFKNKENFNKFTELIPEIEHFICYGMDGLEFAKLWAEFNVSYNSLGFIKSQEKDRASRGKFDRGTENRRAWYASVYLQEKANGKKGAAIKRDIAKFAETIRVGKTSAPALWQELGFEKILHENSTLAGPILNTDLDKEMNAKTDIPYYANEIAPKLELPTYAIKTSE